MCQTGCDRKCLSQLRYVDILALRKEFWASEPSASERRTRIHTALVKARAACLQKITLKEIDPDHYPDHLLFMVGDIEVCQKTFVNALGLQTSAGFKSRTWKDEVDIFIGKFMLHFIVLFVKK